MAVTALRQMTAAQVRVAVDGFASGYVRDWEAWLATPQSRRVELLGLILRRWRATRPYPPRYPRSEARHAPPYLDDLVAAARTPLAEVADLSLATVKERTVAQGRALGQLWDVFTGLTTRGSASVVGITKAVLLLTEGRIGPAFDSGVRRNAGVKAPKTYREWLWALDEMSDDLSAFEAVSGPLPLVVSRRFADLGVGRLYDMALGPR